MANVFDRFRMRMMGVDNQESYKTIQINEDYYTAIRDVKAQNASDDVQKGLAGREVAYSEPVLGFMSTNPEYKNKSSRGGGQDLHTILKQYSDNIVLNTIINTRSNQVATYCVPARYSEKGIGFQVRLKDINKKPSRRQQEDMKEIEQFLLNTGRNKDVTRGNFTKFAKTIVRDTYRYDQVNFEKVFDDSGRLHRFVPVDPTTIYIATDRDGKLIKHGERYVQVMDKRVVATFDEREMAFAIRNPRSDIESAGYGYPEFEISLRQFISHTNTEIFNDRFFSHGGTTRGILQIKADQQQSQHALEMFKREWRNSLKGVNGSWQIPVVSAEDVKFVNMTPSARDLEFEGWLTYLINMITALYQIDPAEIGFPNNGGATGRRGASINDGSSTQKLQASRNRGLAPLLKFIEDTVNDNIVAEFSDEYIFQFVGGDISAEMEKIKVLSEKTSFAMTLNEAREELGLPGDVRGGDIPLNGVAVQRIGQLIQEEQIEHTRKQDRLNRLIEQTGHVPGGNQSNTVTFQDMQQGLAGNSESVDGRGTRGNVGKDGQTKDEENTNGMEQGGQGDD